MSVLNFDGVQDAKGGDMVLPGTKAIFTIAEVEHGTSTNKGTPYLKMKFLSDDGASFTHSFYLSEKALSRIQHLWKHSHGGEELKGQVTIEGLIAGFKGRKVGLKVTGMIGNNGKTYPDLPFGGFACDPTAEALEELQFTSTEQADIAKALENREKQSVNNADIETVANDEADAF